MRRVGYDCDVHNKMCVAQPGGLGVYATLGDCQADCGPKCYVPEMTGPYIDRHGFWHPGHPVHGSPCQRRLVSWENIRENPDSPYHLPCMSKVECETAFHPVTAPTPMSAHAPIHARHSVPAGGPQDANGNNHSIPADTVSQCGDGSYSTKTACNSGVFLCGM